MAQKVIILTEEEYQKLQDEINSLHNDVDGLIWDIGSWADEVDYWKYKYNKLYRLPVEESATEGRAELLDWCAEVAERYEKLDEAEWMEEKARFYNNGLNLYAQMYHLPRDPEIIEEDRKYRSLPFHIWETPENGWDTVWDNHDYSRWCWPLKSYAPYHMIYEIMSEYHDEWREAWNSHRYEDANKISKTRATYDILTKEA